MKITDVICSPGRTGFYFDDQRAIKAGAGHDGVFYTGDPVTMKASCFALPAPTDAVRKALSVPPHPPGV